MKWTQQIYSEYQLCISDESTQLMAHQTTSNDWCFPPVLAFEFIVQMFDLFTEYAKLKLNPTIWWQNLMKWLPHNCISIGSIQWFKLPMNSTGETRLIWIIVSKIKGIISSIIQNYWSGMAIFLGIKSFVQRFFFKFFLKRNLAKRETSHLFHLLRRLFNSKVLQTTKTAALIGIDF